MYIEGALMSKSRNIALSPEVGVSLCIHYTLRDWDVIFYTYKGVKISKVKAHSMHPLCLNGMSGVVRQFNHDMTLSHLIWQTLDPVNYFQTKVFSHRPFALYIHVRQPFTAPAFLKGLNS